jgi:hypothetical protein
MRCALNNQNLKGEKSGDFCVSVCRSALPAKVAGPDHLGGGQVRNGEAQKLKLFIVLPISFDVEKRKGDGYRPRFPVFSGGKCRNQAYIRRRYDARRRKLGKAKKLDAIRKSKDKEFRWMKDRCHKISRQIVNFAVANGVRIIRMEDLTDIRNLAKSK